MPVAERECYKCCQKGHIAINCPSKGTTNEAGQAQGQGSYGTAPNISLGQPQGIYHVEPIEPPGLNGAEEGEWMKQRNQRRKEKKGGRNTVTWSGYSSHALQAGECCHQGEWQERFEECIQKEKDWFDKYAQVQLVERPDYAPEVNEVPQGSDSGDYETVTVTFNS